MPELAKRNMFGFRQLGPSARVRVRVFAGKPIPPDLEDLEDMPDTEAPYANLPATSATAAAPQRSYRSMKKAEVEELANERGVDASGTRDEIAERLEAADAAEGAAA